MSFVIAILALICSLLAGAGGPSPRWESSGDLVLRQGGFVWERAIP